MIRFITQEVEPSVGEALCRLFPEDETVDINTSQHSSESRRRRKERDPARLATIIIISCEWTYMWYRDVIFTNFIEDHHCFVADREPWIISVAFNSNGTPSGYSFSGFMLHCPDRVCLLSPLASCSHIILYFAVLCRMCGNVVIKHCIHSEMDLRPFTSLGQYLNGFTSKKTFQLLIKILCWKWTYLQTEIFICNSGLLALWAEELSNLQMFSKRKFYPQKKLFLPERNSLAMCIFSQDD